MPLHRFEHRFLRQSFYQLELRFCLRYRHIAGQSFVQIDAHLFAVLAHLFFSDGLDNLHPVDIDAQIPFYGSLRLRFRRNHDSGNLVRLCRYRVKIRGSAAYVQYDQIPEAVVQQLGALHDCARRRDDRAVDHIANMFHSRRIGDVLLKSILYNLSTRFYVEVVDLRIYVFYVVKLLSAFLVENQLHLFLILDISRIDDRRLQSQAADFFRIFDGRVPFAVVHAAGDQDQVGIDFLDLRQESVLRSFPAVM